MQIKKEIILFSILSLFCAVLIGAAGFSKEPSGGCDVRSSTPVDCCQNLQKVNNNSPWDFITQGILHLYA